MPLPDDFYDRYPHLREEEPWGESHTTLPPQVRPPRVRRRAGKRIPRRTERPDPDLHGKPFTLGWFAVLQLIVGPFCLCFPAVTIGDPGHPAHAVVVLILAGVLYAVFTPLQLVILRRCDPVGFSTAVKWVLAGAAAYLFVLFFAFHALVSPAV